MQNQAHRATDGSYARNTIRSATLHRIPEARWNGHAARCHLIALHGFVLALTLTTGCLGPRRSDYRTAATLSGADRTDEAERLWNAMQDTLREHRFQLDRRDRRAGIMTTMPVTSQHLFEFWRHDVDTWPDLWESTLNPLRRWVEATVSPAADDKGTCLAIVVHKERFSSPDRQFNSSGTVYEYFGETLPSTTGMPRVTAELDQWVDVGRDPAMEEHLLQAMLLRAEIPLEHPTDPIAPDSQP